MRKSIIVAALALTLICMSIIGCQSRGERLRKSVKHASGTFVTIKISGQKGIVTGWYPHYSSESRIMYGVRVYEPSNLNVSVKQGGSGVIAGGDVYGSNNESSSYHVLRLYDFEIEPVER